MNKRRRLEDRYDTRVFEGRLWTLIRLSVVLAPALFAIAVGYALGPYLDPLF